MERFSSARLVERQGELAQLERALDEAAKAQANGTLVVGEAGIGKSRLVTDLESSARARGMVTMRGGCIEPENGELPYAPLTEALRDAPSDVLSEALQELPAIGRARLAQAFPMPVSDDAPVSSPAAGEERDETERYAQARLFEFLFGLLREIARRKPMLLVLEDLHWADRSTRGAVSFVVRNLRQDRVSVVITHRGEDQLTHEIRRRGARRIELKALTPAGVRTLIGEILGETPTSALVARILDDSGGNPFYVEELLAAWREDPEDRVPKAVAELVLMRYRRLSADAQRVVRAAATIGRPVADDAVLGAVAGFDGTTLSSAVREACDAHLLAYRSAQGTFAFRHAFVRAAVYEDLLPGERRVLHGAAARALEGTAAHAELAVHWRVAGEPTRAFAPSIRAGLAAETGHAAAEAFAHYSRALELRAELGGLPEDAPLDDLELFTRTAATARATGAFTEAIALCDEGLGVSSSRDDVRLAALLELRGRCECWTAPDVALDSLRAARSALPDALAADRMRLLGAEAFALASLLRWEEARDRCRQALVLAPEADDPGEEACVRIVHGLALAFTGEPQAGEGELAHARTLAASVGHAEALMRAHLYHGEVLRLEGRIQDALNVMVEGERVAPDLGLESAFGRYMGLNAAHDLLFLGDWDQVAERINDSKDVLLAEWSTLLRQIVAAQLAMARGDDEEAEHHLLAAKASCETHVEASDYAAPVYAAAAEFELWRHQPARALELVADGMAIVEPSADALNAPELFWIGARAAADAAALAHASGQPTQPALAEVAAARLAGLDAVLGRAACGSSPPAVMYRALCAAEAARAARTPARALWEAAAAAGEACGGRYLEAYARWRVAEAFQNETRAHRSVADQLRRAYAITQALRASRLGGEIEALAKRADVRLGPAPEEGPAGLTGRELEVLQLICEGLKDREIAQRLTISQYTVGSHVRHILTKLRVSNRGSAARKARELGIDQPEASAPQT